MTEAEDDKEPVHKQLPAEMLSHADQCEYVSLVDTFVHSTVADDVIEPDEAAENKACSRVVSVAALLVPFSPGSPVCNLMYTAEGAVQDVVPVRWSRILFSA